MGSLRVLILPLLVFSMLVNFSVAVPTSRTRAMLETTRKSQQVVMAAMTKEEVGRFDLELDDYPGYGANTKHEPEPIGRK